MAPWSLGVGSAGYINVPAGQSVTNTHHWRRCTEANCVDIAAVALRATRDDRLREAWSEARERKRSQKRKEWREAEKVRLAKGKARRSEPKFPLPRLTESEKKEADQRLRAYSLMDYFWRLRIKTNYKDSSMFTSGPVRASDTKQAYRDLVQIAVATLLVHEMTLAKLIGPTEFVQRMEQWANLNTPRDMGARIYERLALIKNI